MTLHSDHSFINGNTRHSAWIATSSPEYSTRNHLLNQPLCGAGVPVAVGAMFNASQSEIAEQVAKDLVELSRATRLLEQPESSDLIGTAHQRISHSAARQLNGESKTGVPHD